MLNVNDLDKKVSEKTTTGNVSIILLKLKRHATLTESTYDLVTACNHNPITTYGKLITTLNHTKFELNSITTYGELYTTLISLISNVADTLLKRSSLQNSIILS